MSNCGSENECIVVCKCVCTCVYVCTDVKESSLNHFQCLIGWCTPLFFCIRYTPYTLCVFVCTLVLKVVHVVYVFTCSCVSLFVLICNYSVYKNFNVYCYYDRLLVDAFCLVNISRVL